MTIMAWHTGTYEWHTDDVRVHTSEYILVHTRMSSVYHSPVVLTMNLLKHVSDHLSAALFLKENVWNKRLLQVCSYTKMILLKKFGCRLKRKIVRVKRYTRKVCD